MKRKILSLIVVSIMILTVVLAGCQTDTTGPDNGDETPQHWNLQFATFWPATDFQVVEGHMVWAKEITERVAEETPHTIEFSIHPGGVLLGPLEIYTGVAAGSADIGTTCPNYTMGIFPLTMGLELPGYNNDNALVASVTMHEAWKMSPELQNEYEDVKIMFFWATGPGDFLTNRPIRKMEDLSGMQIRAAGGSALAISALGGAPVPMPMSEAYPALDSGNVDGILSPTDTLVGFSLAEVTKYITKTPFAYNVVFVKVMNWDTWNSFPPAVQEIFEESNEKYVYEYGRLRTDHTILGQQEAVENYGHEVIELDDNEWTRWIDQIAHLADEWADEIDSNGLPGSELIELYRELDETYSEKYGDYGQ